MIADATPDEPEAPGRKNFTRAPGFTWERYFLWRLVFTKHNELDLGYAFVIPFLALFFTAFIKAALDLWTVTTPMWSALVAVISSMLIATVPVDRARIMRDRGYDTGAAFPPIDPFSIPPSEDAR